MATISKTNGKIVSKIKYKGEIFDVGGGGSEGDVNPLQYIINNHKGDNQPSGEDLFYEYKGSSLDEAINACDFSKITSAFQMFFYCDKLKSIPSFDTSSCTNMGKMFSGCSKLTTIPKLNTSNCTYMGYMFESCRELTTIPQLNTSKVSSMSYMFQYCNKLTTIDITHMKITVASSSASFAENCYSLTKLIIRNMDTVPTLSGSAFTNCYHFTGTVNATYNPQGLKDGRIYVPDDKVDELKTATNWSVYADIIVPLSTLVE